MASATTQGNSSDQRLSPVARSAVRGAWLGFFVDMFDVYLPVVVLAPALIYFISPDMSASTTAIVSGTIFASTLVGRPVGALIFGHFSDRIGRKRMAMISVSGFGVATLLMALLPGYESWGVAVVIIFVALRFVDGVFLGGEYTAASPLAMEHCPKEKRGYYGGLIMTGFPLAYVFISLITFLLLLVIPAGDIDSPYVQWGWRIPFVFGAVLAFGFVLYYHNFVQESEVFEESGGTESPLRVLFSGENLKNFLQVFVMMSGFWLTVQSLSAILPGILTNQLELPGTSVTFTLIIAFSILSLGYVAAALISQRIGRRLFLMIIGAVSAIGGTLFYYILISAAPQNLFAVIVVCSVIAVLTVSCWGLATVYINERFQTGIRASGFGLGYSLAVIIPSFYAYFQAGLGNVMPFEYTVLPLVFVGSVLILVGSALGPETKEVDFHESASPETSARSVGSASESSESSESSGTSTTRAPETP